MTAKPPELVRQGMALTAPLVGGIKQIAETTVEGNRNHTGGELDQNGGIDPDIWSQWVIIRRLHGRGVCSS